MSAASDSPATVGAMMSEPSEVFSEEESADSSAEGFDITPRSPRGERTGRGRTAIAIAVVVAAVVVLGVVVFKGLNDASMFYYNVDEAVANRADLADKRFRMQGNVIDGSIERTDGGVDFIIAYGDARVPVVNRGNPPELFSPKIPVIIEGTFVGDEFHSDEIIIRHDSTYDEDHPDRIADANDDAVSRDGSSG